MVQVLGRLATSTGILRRGGASGWLRIYGAETVFLMGLIIPALSVTGVMLIDAETPERRAMTGRISGGGIVFGLVVSALGIAECGCRGDRLHHLDGRHLHHAGAGDARA